jgi:hypothetical protein
VGWGRRGIGVRLRGDEHPTADGLCGWSTKGRCLDVHMGSFFPRFLFVCLLGRCISIVSHYYTPGDERQHSRQRMYEGFRQHSGRLGIYEDLIRTMRHMAGKQSTQIDRSILGRRVEVWR